MTKASVATRHRGARRDTDIDLGRAAQLLTASLVTASLVFACGEKTEPDTATASFIRRHVCPPNSVVTTKQGSDRLLVTGCGWSEVFVRRCENTASAPPASEPRQPVSENEARFSNGQSAVNTTGCAWSREQQEPNADWRPGSD